MKPQEEEDADKEIPPEPEEKEPEIEQEEIEKEVEKPQEIEKEVVVERPVEVERFKEMPPKADQEEVDLEPDAEKFDQHLFEVRKIFKRPDDDKIKQEEIIKVKDAIDRCLTSYRRIKQEELEERDRQERIRRRREDIEKRAAAFKKQREELEKNGANIDDSALGMDPFSYQKAKIAREKSEEEARKRKEAIKVDKKENLELEDKNTEAINKAIDEMEQTRAKKAERDAKIDEHLDKIDAIMPLENDVPLVSRVRKKRDFSIAKQSAQIAQNSVQNEAENADVQDGNRGTQNTDRKPKIRLAKDTKVNPWGNDGIKKRRINLTPVDESKVAVGDVHVKEDDKLVLWGGNTYLGNLETEKAEQKPKRKYTRKAKVQESEKSDEKTAENVVNSEESTVNDTVLVGENLLENNQEIEQEETVKPVSEMRINIGGRIENTDGMGINFKGETKPVLWGGNANLGKLDGEKTEQKPKRKYTRKPKTEETKEEAVEEEKSIVAKESKTTQSDSAQTGVENEAKPSVEAEQKAVEAEQKPKAPRKKKEKKDPWALSATTLNQKYTLPSGKERRFDAIDEDKVSVGGIKFKSGSGIVDPFGDTFDISAKPENRDDEE